MEKRLGSTNILLYITLIVGLLMFSINVVDAANKETKLRDIDFLPGVEKGLALRGAQAEIDIYTLDKEMCANGDTVILHIGIKDIFDLTAGPFSGPGVVNDSMFVPGTLPSSLYGDTIAIVYHYSDGINTFAQDVVVLGPPEVVIDGDYNKPTGTCNTIPLRGVINSGAASVVSYGWTQEADLYGVAFPTTPIQYIEDNTNLVTSYTYTGTTNNSEVYRLMIEDDKGCRDTVSTRISAYAVSADAGPAIMEVGGCKGTQLDGGLSEGYKLSYQWSSDPANMLATSTLVKDPTSKILASNTVFSLVVTDDFGCTALDSIKLLPIPIEAKAGDDQIITVCENIQLNGSSSIGQDITIRWEQISGPNVVIADPSNPRLNTTHNGVGIYQFKLYVEDNFICKDSDIVIVEVADIPLDLRADKDSIGVCETVSLYADVAPGGTVTWSPLQKLTILQGNNVSFTPTAADYGKSVVFTATVADPICPTSKTYTIFVDVMPVAETLDADVILSPCETGVLDGSFSTGAAPLTYEWSPSGDVVLDPLNPALATFTPTTDKIFTLTVTDKYGCESTTSTSILVTEVDAGANIETPFCSDIQLSATADQGVTTIYWSGSSNLSDTLSLTPTLSSKEWNDFPVGQERYSKTFYFYGLTDDFCLLQDSVTVTATKEDLSFSPSSATISTCGGVIPGTLNNAVEWLTTDYFVRPVADKNSMIPSLLPPVNVAGTTKMYHMLLTDQQSCPQEDSVEVIFIQGVVPTITTPTILYAYPNVPFKVTGVSVAGGTGNYNYNWQPARIFADYTQASPIIINPKAGSTYSLDLTVTDMTTNCVAYARFDVVVSDQFMITSLTVPDDTLCAGSNTTLNLEVFGGDTTNYSYEWTKVGTNGVISTIQDPVVTITEPTTYKVVATDGVSVDEATITLAISDVNANAGSDQYIGSCQSAVLDGSASQGTNLSFAWESIPGLSGDLNSPSITYNGTGDIIKLTVTDVRGCTATDEVEVTVADAPVAVLPTRIDSPGCDPILVDGSGSTGDGLSYSWGFSTRPFSISNASTSQVIFTPFTGGEQTVTLTVSDRFGCTSSAFSIVDADYFSIDLGPDAIIASGDTEPMEVTLVDSDPTATYRLVWRDLPYLQFGSDVMNNLTEPLFRSRTFRAIVSDESGCMSTDTKRVIVFGGELDAEIEGYSASVCPGATVLLNAAVSGGDGNYSYEWKDESDNILGTDVALTFSSVIDQTITLTVTDGANAKVTKSLFVERIQNVIVPEVNFTGGGTYLIGKTPPDLVLEKAQLGVIYELWEGVTLVETIVGNDSPYTWGAPSDGVYRLMAFGNGPCDIAQSNSLTVRGKQLSELKITSLTATGVAVCAGETVTLNLDYTGGDSSNYSVNWKDAADNILSTDEDPIVIVNSTSTYFVTVTDGISTVTSSIEIEVWELEAVLGDDIAIGSCQSVTLDASRSYGDNLSYQWTPVAGLVVQNTASFASYSGPSADIEVIVTDSHNCIDRDTVTVTVGKLQAVLATDSISYSGCSSVELDGSGSKGEQLFYSWSTPSGSVVPANLAKTTFTPSNGGETKVLFSVTDKYGCTDIATVKVNADYLTVDLGDDITIPYGTSTKFIPVVSEQSPSITYTYSWQPAALLVEPTVKNAETTDLYADETFTVTVDALGCTSSDDINVKIDRIPFSTVILGGDDPVCAGDEVILRAKVYAGSGSYSFKWTNGVNSIIGTDSVLTYLPLLPSEVITLEVTDPSAVFTGPTTTATKTITVNSIRIADITLSGGGDYRLGDPIPSISLDNSEVGVTYTLIRNGSVVESIAGTGSSHVWNPSIYGDYIVEATKVGACNAPMSNFVSINLIADKLAIVSLSASNDTVCIGTSVGLDLDISGGYPNDYSYEWSTSDGVFATVQDPSVTVNATKTYTVIVSDGVTTLSASIEIVVSVVTAVLGDDIVMGACQTASLDASNSIGDGLTYNWSSNAGLVVSKTDYIASYKGDDAIIEVFVTDKHGCTASDQLTISVEKVKAVVSTIPTLRCGIVALDASASEGNIISYSWSTLSGSINPSISSKAAFIPANGGTNELILALEDTYGCITLDTTTIVSDYLTVNAGADEYIDAGTSVGLNGSASGQSTNLVYNWSPTSSVVDPISSVTSSNPLNTTTKFTLTAIDQDFGCTASDDKWAFIQGGNLSVTIDGNDGPVCGGDFILLEALPTGGAGNYTYRWETDLGVSLGTSQQLFFQPTADVNLVLTVTDGSSNTAQATTAVKLEFGLQGDVVLTGGGLYTDPNNIPPLTIQNPQVGYLYALIKNGAPIDTITATGAAIQWNSPADGTYFVYASKLGLCGYLKSNIITVARKPFDALAISSLVASSDSVCAGTSVTLNLEVTGGDAANYAYEWSTTNGVISTDQDVVIKPTKTRTYSVVVSDGISSISSSISVFVSTVKADLGADLSIGSCQTVTLDPSASQGVDLSYSWTPTAGLRVSYTDNLALYSGDDATIKIIVTDKYGCESRDSITIDVATAPTIVMTDTVRTSSCSDVILDASTSEGDALAYSWLPLSGTVSVTDLAITNFTPSNGGAAKVILSIEDMYGCKDVDTTTVIADFFTVDAGVDEEIIAGTNGTLEATVVGAGTDFNYSWSPDTSVVDPSAALTTTQPLVSSQLFTVSVTDVDTNCKASDSKIVTVAGGPLSVMIVGNNTSVCSGNTVSLTALVTGGNPDYSYRWLDENNALIGTASTIVFNVTKTTTIRVEVADNILDVAAAQTTIIVGDAGVDVQTLSGGGFYTDATNKKPVVLENSQVDVNYELIKDGLPIDTVVGNGLPIEWAQPADGSYRAVGFKTGGCRTPMSGIVIVKKYDLPPISIDTIMVDKSVLCMGESTTISIEVSGGNETGYTYKWSTPAGVVSRVKNPVVTVNETTTYIVEATDGLTTDADTITITVARVTASAGDDIYMGSCEIATLDASSSIGDNLTYAWEDVVGLSGNLSDTTILYSGLSENILLTVTNKYGCVATDAIDIFVAKAPVAIIADTVKSVGCGVVSLDGSASSGVGLTYSWLPLQGAIASPFLSKTDFVPANGGASEVVLTVTDSYGCSNSKLVTVMADYMIVNAGSDEFIANGSTASLAGTVTGNGTNYTYSWMPSAKVLAPTDLVTTSASLNETSIFTLTVNNTDNGCSASDTKWAYVIGGNLTVVISGYSTPICSGDAVTLNAIVNGGDGNYTIRWENIAKELIGNAQTLTINPLVSTDVSVIVSDASGKMANHKITIEVKDSEIAKMVLSGGGTYCDANNIPSIQLDSTVVDVNYVLLNKGVPVDTIIGTGDAYVWSNPADGEYSVFAYKAGVCNVVMTGAVTVANILLSDLDADIQVANDGNYCLSNFAGQEIWIDESKDNVRYDLLKNNSVVRSIIGGGGRITWVVDEDGIYKISASLINSTSGCSLVLTDSVQVTGYDLPVLANDTSFITQSASKSFITVGVLNGSGRYAYDWSPADRFVNSQEAKPEVLNYTSGEKFSVYITDLLSGCSNTQEVTLVTVIDLDYIGTTVIDSEICQTESAQIKVNTQFGDKNNLIYIWLNHSNVIPDTVYSSVFMPKPNVTSVYELKEVSDGQTKFYPNESFEVVVYPSGLDYIASDYYCQGGNSLLLKPEWTNTVPRWDWFDAASNMIASSDFLSVDVAEQTTFYAIGENEFGCADSSMFVISSIAKPIANDTTVFLDRSLFEDGAVDLTNHFIVGENDAYGELNYFVLSDVSTSIADNIYMFKDEDGQLEYTIAKANFGFIGPDTFKYRITNLYCPEVISEATVTVIHPNKGELFVPIGFSPNGDGYNDVLVFEGLEIYPSYKLMVYNRWGLKVYEANTPTNSWDGKANVSSLVTIGEDLPDGTYYYIIDIPGLDKLTGFVEMMR